MYEVGRCGTSPKVGRFFERDLVQRQRLHQDEALASGEANAKGGKSVPGQSDDHDDNLNEGDPVGEVRTVVFHVVQLVAYRSLPTLDQLPTQHFAHQSHPELPVRIVNQLSQSIPGDSS